MIRLVPALAAALALASCGGAPAEEISIDDAFVTLPAVPGRPGAGYFNLQSNRENVVLTGISSPQAGRVELHETVTQNGVSRMNSIGELALGGEPVRFEPGGRHAMLFDIAPDVAVGGRISLLFAFRGAAPVTVEASVRAPGDVGHGH